MRLCRRSTLALLAAAAVAAAALAAPGPASAAPPADLFISEYVEGSGANKAVEVYNGTASAVDLAAGGYALQVYFNGGPAPATFPLTGT
ncbi:MAG TPA: hypothetical protein VES42_16225, partial [Pilimelia sp.]|nr:hypothetical protein [Pilimelia sp.]